MSEEKPRRIAMIIGTPRYGKALVIERFIADLLKQGQEVVSPNEDADRRTPRRILLDRPRRDDKR
jgi:hypothetical protein